MFPFTSPLPVGSLPEIPRANPAQSPATANAASLFPTLAPKPAPDIAKKARTSPVADTSALPGGAPIASGQYAGLAALALAFILAVARLTARRRTSAAPSPKPSTETSTGSADKPDPATANELADEQDAKDSGNTEEAATETPPADGE